MHHTRTHPHAGGCGWLCGRLRVGFGRAERFSRRALVVGACGRDAMSTTAANDALALPSAARERAVGATRTHMLAWSRELALLQVGLCAFVRAS